MFAAKAIKESGNEYGAYPLQIAVPDDHGGLRTLVCADVLADWIVANCDGLQEQERKLPPLAQRREPSLAEAAAELWHQQVNHNVIMRKLEDAENQGDE